MDIYESILNLWRNYNIQSELDMDFRLDNFRLLFAYNSARIENVAITYHDTREIFENGKILNFTGDIRTIFEQQNQKLCYEFLKPKLIAKQALSLQLIKEVHAILTAGTYDEKRFLYRGERPGEFKKHDYVTGREEVGSAPENVENDLSELINELLEYKGEDILKAAAYFHSRFEYIHPFADGNGRLGRTMLNYYLMINNHPPLIIYDEDKALYYAALESYDREENIEAMQAFLKYQLEKTWSKTLNRNK